MNVEVLRFPGHPSIVVVDGKPFPLAVAAKKLGLTHAALGKRVRRGADLLKPLQRKVFE